MDGKGRQQAIRLGEPYQIGGPQTLKEGLGAAELWMRPRDL